MTVWKTIGPPASNDQALIHWRVFCSTGEQFATLDGRQRDGHRFFAKEQARLLTPDLLGAIGEANAHSFPSCAVNL
jgi:hypothetical protein